MTAADHCDLEAAFALTVVVNGIPDRFSVAGKGFENGPVGSPHAQQNHQQANAAEKQKSDRASEEPQGKKGENRSEVGVIGRSIIFEDDDSQAEPKQERADDGQQDPAFIPNPWQEPASLQFYF